jgi:hypothetical protein
MSHVFYIFQKGVQNRAIQVFAVLLLYFLCSPLLSLQSHRALYTMSVLIKDILLWILPIIVGFFIAGAVSSFQKKAIFFVCALLVFETLSNFSSVCYAFLAGSSVANFLPSAALSVSEVDFQPLFRLPFCKPSWWAADKGSFVGLVLGLASALSQSAFLQKIITQGGDKARFLLTKVFARLIPLFILGLVARMYQTRLLSELVNLCGVLLVWLAIFLAIYIAVLFWLGSRGSSKGFFTHVKNLLPAGAIAFSSGCSISTMPWTIAGVEKNLQNPQLARAVIPATTNIQQIGDCIANSFLCFLVYRQFYGSNPDIGMWMQFSAVFVLARFATAAVLGGAIFIMLPIYEKYLSFNGEMIALLLAFNVLLDPLITSSNVLANGALCRIFERVWGRKVGEVAKKGNC